jgi:glyoxylase-like metal-dependent hydrolase (beta-lactamase superfamily II)
MAGIRPSDVETVVLTHAHPGHIGGAVSSAGRPTFLNARHILAEIEWDFWMTGRTDLRGLRVSLDVQDSMRATARRCPHTLRFQAEPIGGETEIAPGVRAIPAPGNTPGHLAILLSSEGQHLINAGDAAVHPPHPGGTRLGNGFDQAAGLAVSTRRGLLERAVAESMHLMAFHFPFPSVGPVAARAEGGWSWTPGR